MIADPTAASGPWAIEAMRFRFQLGETQFYARSFDVAVLGKRFLDIEGDPEDVQLPLDTFAGRVAAYVILSHPIARPLPVVSMLPQVVRYASHQYRRGFIRVDKPFDAYLAGLSSNKRNQLKRKVKKFRERFGDALAFDEYSDAARMPEFHARARAVSAKTYQEKLFKKGLPTDAAFLADMEARTRGGAGRARGWLLREGERPIAYLYAVIDDGFLTYDFVGYDPDYAEWSPGNVLQYMILERVFAARTCRIFDFGEGESQYKDFFSTDSVPCADIYYFPRDPRGYALAGSQAGLFYLSRSIVHTLDRFGLKHRIKTVIRTGKVSALFEKSAPRADGPGGKERDDEGGREAKDEATASAAERKPDAKGKKPAPEKGDAKPRAARPDEQGDAKPRAARRHEQGDAKPRAPRPDEKGDAGPRAAKPDEKGDAKSRAAAPPAERFAKAQTKKAKADDAAEAEARRTTNGVKAHGEDGT